MKVKKLIAELQKQNPEAVCVVRGYEGGVDHVNSVEASFIKRYQNTVWYYGQHEIATEGEKAVYISGNNQLVK